MGRLEGKIALVTGAGSGLGRAISQEFARQGAHVFVSDRDEAHARETADAIAADKGAAAPLRADVTSSEDIAAMFKSVESASGKLHILVNNAGITQRSDFRHQADAEWQQILDVNLHGVIRCSREALALLRAAKGGSIINMSSIMGQRHIRQLSAYSTTKAAVCGLSRSMAVEYASFDIRVNSLCPGYVETALTEQGLRNPAVRKALLLQTPMGRFAAPRDVAKAALFLASDDSVYITGSDLTVDGGMSIAL